LGVYGCIDKKVVGVPCTFFVRRWLECEFVQISILIRLEFHFDQYFHNLNEQALIKYHSPVLNEVIPSVQPLMTSYRLNVIPAAAL
jgi:hypothetical protein